MGISKLVTALATLTLLATAQSAFADLYSAIHGCANVARGLGKSRISGTSRTSVRVLCDGIAAKRLYEAVRFYSSEYSPRKNDSGWTRITRYFGESRGDGNPVSQCHHTIRTPDGRSISEFACSLKIDVTRDVMASNLFDELNDCALTSRRLSKNRIDGTSSTTVTLVCHGEVARRLFDGAAYYSRESDPSTTDRNERTITRFFGNSTLPSQCSRVLSDAYGRSVNEHTCHLTLDLSDDVTAAM